MSDFSERAREILIGSGIALALCVVALGSFVAGYWLRGI